MPLSPRSYRALLRAACAFATEQNLTLVEALNAIIAETYEPVMKGEGMFDIQSASNAGQSTTVATDTGAPGKSQVGDAVELLLTLAEQCLADNPNLSGPDLCACVMGKLPMRGVRSFRSSYHAMTPEV